MGGRRVPKAWDSAGRDKERGEGRKRHAACRLGQARQTGYEKKRWAKGLRKKQATRTTLVTMMLVTAT